MTKVYKYQTVCYCNSKFLLAFILGINEALINFRLGHVTVIQRLVHFNFGH